MSGDFALDLASLCHKEFMASRGDPERIANMVERLMHSAGYTIAMGTNGDTDAMQTLLIGAEAYLNESAAEHGESARLIASLTERFRK